METFILIAGLIAAGTGTLVLLLSLAQKRAQLVRAFNIKLEIEQQEQMDKTKQSELENSAECLEPIPTPVGIGAN